MRTTLLFIFFCLASLEGFCQGKFLFEENRGQWHEDVLFRTGIPGGYLFVTKRGLKYVYMHPDDWENYAHHQHAYGHNSKLRADNTNANSMRMHAVEVVFEHSNGLNQVERHNEYPFTANYFIGNDPSKWVKDVRKFEEVEIKDIYPDIDLRLYSSEDNLKYDLILQPGSHLNDIELSFRGAKNVDEINNDLEVKTSFSVNKELAPYSYQETKKGLKEIKCRYSVDGNKLRFLLPDGYNKRKTLVIDPELIFSTYSGSFADNWGFTATFDKAGNVYSGGIVFNIGFPVNNGAYQTQYGGNVDIGILKYDSLGEQLMYATYIGGSEAETPNSMIVDHNGDLIIYGTTSSPDFPISSNAYQKTFLGGTPLNGTSGNLEQPVSGISFNNGSDIFLFKLSEDGSKMKGSTFLGGSENDGIMLRNLPLTKNYGDQFRGEVNVDKSDNVYIASYTSSTDFPIENGIQTTFGGGSHDGIVASLNSDLSSLNMSTYIGGNGMDGLYSIKIDKDENIVVAGGTASNNYPVTGNAIKNSKSDSLDIDGVVTKINISSDSISASTYLGTAAYDQVYFVELDSAGNIYVLGQTQGQYPVTNGVYSNPNSGQFIHKLTPSLDSTYFSTVFGSGSSSPDIRPTAFLVNECENLLISGWGGGINAATDFFGLPTGYVGGDTRGLPLTENAFQKTTDGRDFYLVVLLQGAKELLYATYFGGPTSPGDHVDGGTSRFDNRGIVYQAVCASCGGRVDDFPTTPGAWSRTNNSSNCNNAVFKFDVTQLKAAFVTNSFEFDQPGLKDGCWPLEVVFLNKSIGGISFEWDFGNGIQSTLKDSLYITYDDPGIYDVSLKATDIATCVREDVARGTIEVFDQTFSLMEPQKICYGDEITLSAGGGVAYEWTPAKYLDNPNISNPVAKPDTSSYFSARVTNQFGCVVEDSVLITVVPDFTVDYLISRANNCFDTPNLTFHNLSDGPESYIWDLGNGETSDLDSLIYNYQVTDTFNVSLTGKLDICQKVKTSQQSSVKTFIPNIITPNNDGKNEEFRVITDTPINLKVVNRWGDPVYQMDHYDGSFNGSDLASGVYYYEVEFVEDDNTCHGWLQILK